MRYRDWLSGHYWLWKRKYGTKQIDGLSHLKPLRPRQVGSVMEGSFHTFVLELLSSLFQKLGKLEELPPPTEPALRIENLFTVCKAFEKPVEDTMIASGLDGDFDRARALREAKLAHQKAIADVAEAATILIEKGILQASTTLGRIRQKLAGSTQLDTIRLVGVEARTLAESLHTIRRPGADLCFACADAIEAAAAKQLRAELLCLRLTVSDLHVSIYKETMSSGEYRQASNDAKELAEKLRLYGGCVLEAEMVESLQVKLEQAAEDAQAREEEKVRLAEEARIAEEEEEKRRKRPDKFIVFKNYDLDDKELERQARRAKRLKEKNAALEELKAMRAKVKGMADGRTKEGWEEKLEAAEVEYKRMPGADEEEAVMEEEEPAKSVLTSHVYPEEDPELQPVGKLLSLDEFQEFVVTFCLYETRPGNVVIAIKQLIKETTANPDASSSEVSSDSEADEDMLVEEEDEEVRCDPEAFEPELLLRRLPLGIMEGHPMPGPEVEGQERMKALNLRAKTLESGDAVVGKAEEIAALQAEARAVMLEGRGEKVAGKGVPQKAREEATALRLAADIAGERRVFASCFDMLVRWFHLCGRRLSYSATAYRSRAKALAGRSVRNIRNVRAGEGQGGDAQERDMVGTFSRKPWRAMTPPLVRRRLQGMALRDSQLSVLVHGGAPHTLHDKLALSEASSGRRALWVMQGLWGDYVKGLGSQLAGQMAGTRGGILHRTSAWETFERIWVELAQFERQCPEYVVRERAGNLIKINTNPGPKTDLVRMNRSWWRGLPAGEEPLRAAGETERARVERKARRILQEAAWLGAELAAEVGEKSPPMSIYSNNCLITSILLPK